MRDADSVIIQDVPSSDFNMTDEVHNLDRNGEYFNMILPSTLPTTGIIERELCKSINVTHNPPVEIPINEQHFKDTLEILKQIKIKDYKYLLIIIGGKCYTNNECYLYRDLMSLHEKSIDSRSKTLILIIDYFRYSSGRSEELYNPNMQTHNKNEYIDIQHLNIILSLNVECIFNKYLISFVKNITGFVIIINSAVYITGEIDNSISTTADFLNGIFGEDLLKKNNILIYIHNLLGNITKKHNWYSNLRLHTLLINQQLKKLTQKYDILDYIYKYYGLNIRTAGHLKKFKTTNVRNNRISSPIILNFILKDKLK